MKSHDIKKPKQRQMKVLVGKRHPHIMSWAESLKQITKI